MLIFLAWLVLLVLCWPLARPAPALYPVVWLVQLPFRLAGVAFHGVLELLRAVILLPVRILRLGRVYRLPYSRPSPSSTSWKHLPVLHIAFVVP